MDINSLLSPSESPRPFKETPPPPTFASPSSPSRLPAKRPAPQQRKSSGLSRQVALDNVTPSPRTLDPSYTSGGQYFPQQPPLPSPGLAGAPHLVRSGYSASVTPTSEPRTPLGPILERPVLEKRPSSHRQGSTSGMDTLADLASMQHHQQTARQNSAALEPPRSPSINFTLQNLSHVRSKDVAMADPSRKLSSASLTVEDSQAINELYQQLTKAPYKYEPHTRLIGLLRQGFLAASEKRSYELLNELREARHAMNQVYPVGEELWVDWIEDEAVIAKSTDERINVMELCSKAMEDEPNSVRLWRLYGDYMYSQWAEAHELVETEWYGDDLEVGKEVFTWDTMAHVWEKGVAATQWRLKDSNVVWDRYAEIRLEDLDSKPSQAHAKNVMSFFTDRLLKPHATWDATFQIFSSFVTRYDSAGYEATMTAVNEKAAQAKRQYELREPFELRISAAERSGNKTEEWAAYIDYLDWEVRKKGVFSHHLINALFERATIRFSTDANLWQDYVEFLIENPSSDVSTLNVLERATKHCPWSGALWSHRLLTMEAEGRNFEEMQAVKHLATSAGLLNVGGVEELLKVYVAWCGFLRRKAFQDNATEDDRDIAEVGIHSALEHVKEIGKEKYGAAYKGDPLYRLEKIHIKFFTQSGNVEMGRRHWKQLVAQQGDNYDFWYRYYIWEMVIWAKYAMKQGIDNMLREPNAATDVLDQAMARVETLDWPEQFVPMYLSHYEQHESVKELREASIQVRKAWKIVQARRTREAAEAQVAVVAADAQPMQIDRPEVEPSVEDPIANGKRKRDDEEEVDFASKKVKATTEVDPRVQDTSASSTSQAKRDRERTTIVVRNLPLNATETRVRQFFTDCGKVLSIKLMPEEQSQTAHVEFETGEEADFAQSKSSKPFDGNDIDIQVGGGMTLYVANYPPTADEKYIRKLFEGIGEIVECRFPSLQYNTHRRFCYVQFLTATQAKKAEKAMDGQKLEGQYDLIAKISDPGKKKGKEGAMHQEREICVRNLRFGTTEDEVKELFEPYGTVERVRFPTNAGGKMKGFAYVVMDTKETAAKAIEATRGSSIRGRPLIIELSKAVGVRRTARLVVNSASPDPGNPNGNRNAGSPDDAVSPAASVDVEGPHAGTDVRQRRVALLNLPDTLGTARVETLCEPYGAIRQITLRPDHGGAIVEFVDQASVGKVALGLDGREVDGRVLQVGTVGDLLASKKEYKVQRLDKAKATGKAKQKPKEEAVGGGQEGQSKSSGFMPPAPVRRPGLGGGKRGGLGTKTGRLT